MTLASLLKPLCYLMWICAISSVRTDEHAKVLKRAIRSVDFFKLRLHQKLETDRLHRNYDLNDESDPKFLPSILTRKLQPVNSFELVKVWLPVDLNEKEKVFAITGDQVVSYFEDFSSISSYFFPAQEIYALQAFQDGTSVWLVTFYRNEQGRHVMQLYQNADQMPISRQVEGLPGPSLLTIVRVKKSTYLVLLSNTETVCLLKLFLWSGTQFVFTAKEAFSTRCHAVGAWSMDMKLYVAVGFEGKSMSRVLVYNKASKNFSSIQYLGSCHVIQHFVFLGNHHLICGAEKASLYWWSNSKFMKLQEFTSSSKVLRDAAVHFQSSESVVLILAWKDGVEFYFQDLSSRYVKFGDINFGKEEFLKSLKLWRKAPALFILPVFEGVHPPTVYGVHISINSSKLKNEFLALQNCTSFIKLKLNVNKDHMDELSSKMDNILTSKKHTSTSSLYVNGSVASKSVKAQKVFISDATARVDKLNNYKNLSSHFKELITAIQNLLATVLLKTGKQDLKSNVSFARPISVFQGEIKKLHNEVSLNEVKSSMIPICLKTYGRQIISSPVSVDALAIKDMNAVSINDKQIENLLVLNKPTAIEGYLTLPRTTVKDFTVFSTINNFRMSDLVLSSKSQSVYGVKHCANVTASAISARKVNGVDVSSIKTAYLAEEKIDHNLNFTSSLVLRNANVTIKGFNFSYFLANVVTRNNNQTIKGLKSFKNFSVETNLSVAGLVNEMNISYLMLKHVPQVIYGSFVFFNISFQEIATDSVNSLDLSSAACTKRSASNSVRGKIRFSEALSTSNVVLKENVLLDYVDPSKVTYDIKACCDLTSNTSMQFGKVIVKGDAEFRNEKPFSFLNMMSKVWLKSVPQNISYGKFKKISVDEMEVKLLNGLEIKNLVPIDGDAVIDSVKWFENNTSVRRMDIAQGKNVTLPLKFMSERTIFQVFGNISIPYMFIDGNLSIFNSINNVSVSDIMAVFGKQVCNSDKVFQTVKISELKTKNISFNFFNKANLRKTFGDLVVRPFTNVIKNKWFPSLTGKYFNVTGSLGGKNFTYGFQNIATLHSNQEIHAHHVFKSLSANSLHARNLNNTLNMVVCKDEAKYVEANKTFVKGLFTKTMNVPEKVNYIDVAALQSNAFVKHGSNSLQMRATFLSDLKMNKLYMKKYSTMDGISFSDFILVHENSTLDAFNASLLTVGNVTLNGCFSACCLNSVLENAIYFPKELGKMSYFKRLEVNGDVIFSHDLLSDLMYLNDSLMSSNLYGNFIFGDIRSRNFQVLGSLNDDVDLDFMFMDCVNNKTAQVVPAKKVFSYLTSTNASVKELILKTIFNESSEQFFGLYKNSENGTLVYWKNLLHLFVKSVTIHGTLNSVQLPENVVLTDGDEVIYADVFVNATINVTSGIRIDGSVNGIKLDLFLKERATLMMEENISSKIIFANDSFVMRYLEADKINNISLTDVLKVDKGRKLTGVKVFQNVSFHSDLNVEKEFNSFNLSKLMSSIAKISGNESIEMLTFEALNVTDLSNTSVNGVSANALCDEMHDVDFKAASLINNLTNQMNSLTEDLSFQKEESEHELTMFEFFTLYQVLKPHHTQRFLPVFEPGTFGGEWERRTSQMIIWAERKNGACTSVLSYVMNVLPDGSLTFEKKLKGRVYPFSLQLQLEDITGFWVHMEKNSCRKYGKSKLIVNTVYASEEVRKNEIVIPSNASVLDVKLFEDEEVYLLILFKSEVLDEKIHIYEYQAENNSWAMQQAFHPDIPSAYDLISEEGGQFPFHLAVASEAPNSSISIYTWVDKKFELFIQHAKPAISAVLWVQTEKELCLLLARANSTLSRARGQPQTSLEVLEVLALADDLVLDHTVSIHNVQALKKFSLDGEIFVLACSRKLQVVYVLWLRGHNGFQIVQEVPAPGVVGALLFTTEDDDVILAVNSDTGHTRTLKATIKGDRFSED